MSEQLFLIALIPPNHIYEQAISLKQEVSDLYASKAALRSPPHITLHMPFKANDRKLAKIDQALSSLNMDHIQVDQQGFGCFEPKVIYVNVKPSVELMTLYGLVQTRMRKLQYFNAEYKNRGFHPHMTIAFRDLKKSAFYEAWEYYRNKPIAFSWKARSLFLLKHNGSLWECFKEFHFDNHIESDG